MILGITIVITGKIKERESEKKENIEKKIKGTPPLSSLLVLLHLESGSGYPSFTGVLGWVLTVTVIACKVVTGVFFLLI